MSATDQSQPHFSGYELLAKRSDGYFDAQRLRDGQKFLIIATQPAPALVEPARRQFALDRARAEGLRGGVALELVEALDENGAFAFVLPHFAGRSLYVQIARGRKFTPEAALKVAQAIARTLAASKQPHGDLTAMRVLADESSDAIRLAPPLLAGTDEWRAGSFAGDLRALGLLLGHLVLGEEQALPTDDARTSAAWIKKPEVPAAWRTLLTRMLAPIEPFYSGWEPCIADLERAIAGKSLDAAKHPVHSSPARRAPIGGLLLRGVLLIGLAGGTWWWTNQRKTAPVIASAPKVSPAAPTAPAAPVSEPIKTTAPMPEQPAPEVAVDINKDFLDYLRAVAPALSATIRQDAAGALASLDKWLGEHPTHAHREDLARQRERIAQIQSARTLLIERGSTAVSGKFLHPDGTQLTLMRVADGKFAFSTLTQFGTVEKTIPAAELPETIGAAILSSLAKPDAAAALIIGSGQFDEAKSSEPAVQTWVEEWRELSREVTALAAFDNVAALFAKNDPGAGEALETAANTHGDTRVATAIFAERILRWREQIAAANKPTEPLAAAYPGLPVLTLSSVTLIGDPESKKLSAATRYAIEKGAWREHRAALNDALVAAGKLGAWNRHAENLGLILTRRVPAMILAQATAIRGLSDADLARFSKDVEAWDFLSWVFGNPRAMQLLADNLKPQDKAARVLEIWRDLWVDDPAGREKYLPLALAVALVHDDPVGINPQIFSMEAKVDSAASDAPKVVNPLERYRFYRECARLGKLRVPLEEMTPAELVWVVDAPVPTSELEWAQTHVNYSRRDWSKAYGSIRYRMDKAAGGRQIYDLYTLEEIRKEGGICGDQAYFSVISAKANGIPAMVIGGEGERGGHAWFGYKEARNKWNLDSGRFEGEFAAGSTVDPQTHQRLIEFELHQFADPLRRTEGWQKTERYLQLYDLLAAAKEPQLARMSLDGAVLATPKHLGAWMRRMDAIAAASTPVDEYQREIARMRLAFREHSDLVRDINNRETAYLEKHDPKLALKTSRLQTDRLERKDGERTDLILDSVWRSVELAQKSGDTALIGRLYRDALDDQGGKIVAFKPIATRYYKWGKEQQKGRDALRDIDRAFSKNFDEPTGDFFAMGAYQAALAIVIDLHKQEGLTADVNRLERVAARIKKRQEKIGEQSKKNERVN